MTTAAAAAHLEVTSAPAPSIRRSMVPMLIIAAAICSGFTMMLSFGIAAETAKRELGLSDAALGVI